MTDISSVKGLIKQEGKYLLIKRIINGQEDWSLPGGRVEKGEDIKSTLMRDIKEELGLKIKITTYLGTYYFYRIVDGKKVVCQVYQCEIASGNLKPTTDEDIELVRLLTKEEILEKKLSSNSLKELIKKI